ncbi:porin [Mesorhizobium sp. NBSH29]|uniref:porin n=1 Tax=Mesorhizobium sp. NBSH29 TaxID=2654249 RepID=UPI001896620B|nr:porin [Mesorhizobium sp. NBSH29]QPC85845.1 porin [Mesorhizobium sp. NBSH29]
MNIRSLILGSAASLVAISGARAADPVVLAEPEPVEYVRVCDVYGAGFYYMPGTETCLNVGGYVRYDIGAGFLGHEDVVDKKDLVNGIVDFNDTYYKRARAALKLDARTDTELGTLRSFMQINFNWDTTTLATNFGDVTSTKQAVDVEHAYIELGGFLIGRTDTFFDTFSNYAGNVINDDLIAYGPTSKSIHTISYTFHGTNGFSAGLALEEGYDDYTIDSYVPHVTGGVKFTQGWGGVSVMGGYDSVYEEWAAKARLDFVATQTISAFVMGGFKSDDAGEPNFYGQWGGDWAVWGGMTATVSPKAAFNVQLSYDDHQNFAAVANVAYELVPGLTITPEVVYADNFDDDTVDAFDGGKFGGFLRFQRSF